MLASSLRYAVVPTVRAASGFSAVTVTSNPPSVFVDGTSASTVAGTSRPPEPGTTRRPLSPTSTTVRYSPASPTVTRTLDASTTRISGVDVSTSEPVDTYSATTTPA